MATRPEDGVEAQERLGAQQLDVMLRRLGHLPSLPGVIKRLVGLLGSAQDAGLAAAEQVTALVGVCPSLSARVLSLANASTSGPVRTVAQAVGALGAEGLQAAVLAAPIVPAHGSAGGPDSGLDRAGFWRHCLGTACAASLLAEYCQPPLPRDELYAAGLLHDLGKLALEQCLPKSYGRVLAAARGSEGNIADCERATIGTDHQVVGRRLAELWRLPDSIGQVMWLHHQPAEAVPASLTDRALIGIVGLADAVARREGIGFSGNYTFPRSCEQLAREVGIPASAVDEVAAKLDDAVGQRLAACQVSLDEQAGDYAGALAAANAALARIHDRLRARAGALVAGAGAFETIGQFAAALRPDATVADCLSEIAGVVKAMRRAGPVVAYSAGGEASEVLVVRSDRTGGPAWRALARAAAFDIACPPGPAGACDDVAAALLAAPDELADWLDLTGYRHLPLVCGGQWIGGAFYSAGPSDGAAGEDSDPVVDGLAAMLALSLSIVQQRRQAVLLSEQLASASQMLAETQEALAESKTMAMVGEMAAGAAHELNNPLAVISGRAQLMRERAEDPRDRKTWQLIAEQAQRVSDVITQLMNFASPAQPAPEAFDVPELLAEAANRFSCSKHLHARLARVDITVGESVPKAYADRSQMAAVIEELIVNAATAATSEPRIALVAEVDDVDGSVLMTVRDDGPGMDDSTRARAFTPFFSVQRAGRRRGLGLPLAKRYVENNGGRIRLRSRPGEGTTVTLQIPAARPGIGRTQETQS